MSSNIDLTEIATHEGQSLEELSRESPLLVVFLRHAGCPNCRETLADLEQRRGRSEDAGVKIVLVHMIDDNDEAEMFFARYRLHDVPRVSDPEQKVYRRFGLARGTLSQVMGVRLWWQGFKTVLRGHLPGKPVGDIFQLPGAFLLEDGKVVREFKSRNSIEHPDYLEFAENRSDTAGC